MLARGAFATASASSHLPTNHRAHAPTKGAASREGLYQEHILVGDIAQYPVDQLPIERDSVHAAYLVNELLDSLES